jgi:hydrogenase/urease accessory protein HupE
VLPGGFAGGPVRNCAPSHISRIVLLQRRQPTSERWTGRACRCALGAAAAIAVLAAPASLAAHEIPQRVAVRAFVQHDDTLLRVLVRVPLEAMRDVDFPLRGDGSLDLVAVRALLADAAQTWIVSSLAITADGRTLAAPRITGTRVALPNDRAFEQFDSARGAFSRAPLESEITLWQQLLLDVALEYTVPSGDARIELHPDFARLGMRTTSVVHIVKRDGSDRVLTYAGNPESVSLNPAWYQTALQFARDGFRHIPSGADHLLFLICLVLPVRRWRDLIAIVTAFTIAHSLTLGASALGFVPSALWFPPLVEVLIAASIVWLGIENCILPAERLAARWPVAFAFGLVHGFGFSFALREQLQFAGANLVTALAAFNIGVEFGQLLVLGVAVPMLWLLYRYTGANRERAVTIVGSALVTHTAWHWLTERGEALAEYRGALSWPAWDAALALDVVRITLFVTVAVVVALALRQILRVPKRS